MRIDRVLAAQLSDAYGPLLTERQREVWSLVYDRDWSLAEVAEATAVSRAAVAETLTRTQARLAQWEARLALVAATARRQAHLAELERLAEALPAGDVASRVRELCREWLREEGLVDPGWKGSAPDV